MTDIVGGGMSDNRDLSDIDTKRPQITRSVDSLLRDRIAAVLASVEVVLDGDTLNDTSTWLLADAVIRELGLTRVTRSERVPKHRYVTEWENDQ